MNLEPINQIQLYGLTKSLDELIHLHDINKLPSKILLSGQKGIGKCTLAYHLINYVLSHEEDNAYDKNTYQINIKNRSFKLVKNGTSSNFNLIDVKPEKKSVDVSQIRDLINLMNKSSFNNKPRFILIDNIEYLNLNSINALLKFLEEPNQNVYFILIHNNSKILKTLKSRCLPFKLFLTNKESCDITKKIFQTDISNKINLELINYYFTPGNIVKLVDFFDKSNFKLKDLRLKELLELIIKEKIYKNNLHIKLMLYEFIEFFLVRSSFSTKNLYYNYFINQIDNLKKFNLDEDSFYIEFKSKILNG